MDQFLPTGVPHCLVSVVGPVHPVLHGPPLIHALDRVMVPVPHRTEQALKGPQAPIRDGTERKEHTVLHTEKNWIQKCLSNTLFRH